MNNQFRIQTLFKVQMFASLNHNKALHFSKQQVHQETNANIVTDSSKYKPLTRKNPSMAPFETINHRVSTVATAKQIKIESPTSNIHISDFAVQIVCDAWFGGLDLGACHVGFSLLFGILFSLCTLDMKVAQEVQD